MVEYDPTRCSPLGTRYFLFWATSARQKSLSPYALLAGSQSPLTKFGPPIQEGHGETEEGPTEDYQNGQGCRGETGGGGLV